MSSWFSSLADLKDKVQSSVTDLATKTTNAATHASSTLGVNPDLLQKLTLQSPELKAERQRIDEEERHKEQVRDSLAEILPWETRDVEMEILVEECKEVIMGLSGKQETFTGPFVLAGGLPTATSNPGDVNKEDGDGIGGKGGEEEELNHDSEEILAKRAEKDLQAAQLSAHKLAKLQPLPTLLSNFDLDTHVGLIQRLFKIDPKLVGMHSRLSSGGKREETFWKNYFFHCAYTRYEAGLSIDEIWSSEHHQSRVDSLADMAKEEEEFNLVDGNNVTGNSGSDDEVVFDSASDTASRESGSGKALSGEPGKASSSPVFEDQNKGTQPQSAPVASSAAIGASTSKSSMETSEANKPSISQADYAVDSSVGGTDYELVSDADGDADDTLDELEAEIAAALDD